VDNLDILLSKYEIKSKVCVISLCLIDAFVLVVAHLLSFV
jgi:hypothetical protein